MERVNRPGKLYATEQTLTLTPEEVAFSVTSPTQNGPVNLGAPVMELGSADRGKRYTVMEYKMLQLAANLLYVVLISLFRKSIRQGIPVFG